MTDYSELKRLASAAKNWGGEVGEHRWYESECFKQPYFSVPDAEFIAGCEPGAVLALIAENASLKGSCMAMGKDMGKVTRERNSARAKADQLKAEVEALRKERDKLAEDNRGLLEDFGGPL